MAHKSSLTKHLDASWDCPVKSKLIIKMDFKWRAWYFRGSWKTQGGIFCFLKMALAFSKQKWKKTQPLKSTLISTRCDYRSHSFAFIKTILKLQLRWLFRGPVRLQPGEIFPGRRFPPAFSLASPSSRVYFIHKTSCGLLLSEGKAHFDLSHSTKSPISWSDEESH